MLNTALKRRTFKMKFFHDDSCKNVGVTGSLGTIAWKKISFDQRLKGWAKGAAQKCVDMSRYP